MAKALGIQKLLHLQGVMLLLFLIKKILLELVL